jgi:hypothetical protein
MISPLKPGRASPIACVTAYHCTPYKHSVTWEFFDASPNDTPARECALFSDADYLVGAMAMDAVLEVHMHKVHPLEHILSYSFVMFPPSMPGRDSFRSLLKPGQALMDLPLKPGSAELVLWATIHPVLILSIIVLPVWITSQGIGKVTDGIHGCCNGVYKWKAQDFFRNINHLQWTHICSVPCPNKSDCNDCIPLSSDNASSLQQLQGPVNGMKEHTMFEILACFQYCHVLGELIYGYMVCWLDFSFAATFVAHFADVPALEH